MKAFRVIHMRAPLPIHHFVGGKKKATTLDPTTNSMFGGATIVIEGDTALPGFVKLQVAFCRWSDNYCRKLGRDTAKQHDVEVLALRELPSTLRDIERQMLWQVVPTLRDHEDGDKPYPLTNDSYLRDWNHVVRHFLPLPPKEEVAP
jgi:hypothetical protein